MPITVFKGSFQYAVKNKSFFLFVSALIFVLYYFSEIYDPTKFVLTVLSLFCMVGYGLQITEDVINGGTRLPKINFKILINFGVKGFIIHFFTCSYRWPYWDLLPEFLTFQFLKWKTY